MQKVKVSRFECFHISAKWKSNQQSFFYLEFSREGSKEEKARRKELAKLLGQEKRRTERYTYHQLVEGIGFIWRVEASIIAKYADWLDLPCTIEDELKRFKREGIRQPIELIAVNRIMIYDIEKSHLISSHFNSVKPMSHYVVLWTSTLKITGKAAMIGALWGRLEPISPSLAVFSRSFSTGSHLNVRWVRCSRKR